MLRIKSDLSNININARDLLKVKGKLQVGFFESAKYPNGVYVAQVARYNEFGTSKIPMRPFFRNAINTNTKKWFASMQQLLRANDDRVLEKVGEIARGDIVQSITTLNTPPNKQSTIDTKKSSNPLIDTGLMRRSVTYKVSKWIY